MGGAQPGTFLTAYLAGWHRRAAAVDGRPAALLALFELDKAVYELGYERAHRPDLAIPLAGIERLRRPRPQGSQ